MLTETLRATHSVEDFFNVKQTAVIQELIIQLCIRIL